MCLKKKKKKNLALFASTLRKSVYYTNPSHPLALTAHLVAMLRVYLGFEDMWLRLSVVWAPPNTGKNKIICLSTLKKRMNISQSGPEDFKKYWCFKWSSPQTIFVMQTDVASSYELINQVQRFFSAPRKSTIPFQQKFRAWQPKFWFFGQARF